MTEEFIDTVVIKKTSCFRCIWCTVDWTRSSERCNHVKLTKPSNFGWLNGQTNTFESGKKRQPLELKHFHSRFGLTCPFTFCLCKCVLSSFGYVGSISSSSTLSALLSATKQSYWNPHSFASMNHARKIAFNRCVCCFSIASTVYLLFETIQLSQ